MDSTIVSKTDMTGHRAGKWLVISFAGRINGHTMWNCRCDCGTERRIDQYALRNALTASCGCNRHENTSKAKTTHGWSHHRICGVWHGMITRCHKPKSSSYAGYGGRGISVCERWRGSLQLFIDDMGLPPSNRHTIDRIDNDGNYEPGNCRWATMSEQNRNNRHSVLLTFNGRTQCMIDWANELGIEYHCLIGRLRRGWTTEEALTGVRSTLTYSDRIIASVVNHHAQYGKWPTLRVVAKNTNSKACDINSAIEILPNLTLVALNNRTSMRSTLVVYGD